MNVFYYLLELLILVLSISCYSENNDEHETGPFDSVQFVHTNSCLLVPTKAH